MNIQAKIQSLPNPLAEFKAINEEVKALEARRSMLREQILNLMNSNSSDEVVFGGFKAKRVLVVQERLDTKLVKEFLGNQYSSFVTESSQIRLSVI